MRLQICADLKPKHSLLTLRAFACFDEVLPKFSETPLKSRFAFLLIVLCNTRFRMDSGRIVGHSETLCRSLFTSCELYTSLLAN